MAIIDRYISPTGSNSNDGLTPSTPWLTVAYANTNIPNSAGDTSRIFMADGTYNATSGHTFSRSGADINSRIQFIAINKYGAVLTAGSSPRWICTVTGLYLDFIKIACTGPNNHGGFYCNRGHIHWTNCHIYDIATNVVNVEAGGGGIVSSDLQNGSAPPTGYIIEGCWIHHTGIPGSSGTGGAGTNLWYHGIYDQADGTIIRNNIIYNCGRYGIQMYHDARNTITVNNTLVGSPTGILNGSGGPLYYPVQGNGFTTNNNIICDTIANAVSEQGLPNPSTIEYRNNCLFGNASNSITATTNAPESGNTTTNPQFVGYVVGSFDYTGAPDCFKLQVSSPCINTGSTSNAPTVDFAGNLRTAGVIDRGAYEYGSGASSGTGDGLAGSPRNWRRSSNRRKYY